MTCILKNFKKGHCDLSLPISPQLMSNFSSVVLFFPSVYKFNFLAIEVYKHAHNLNPLCLNIFIHKNIYYDLRNKHKVEQPNFNTKRFGYRSFMYYHNYGSLGQLMLNFPIQYRKFRAKITKWCFAIQPNDFHMFRLILVAYISFTGVL